MLFLFQIFVLVLYFVTVQSAKPTPTPRPNKNGWPWYLCGYADRRLGSSDRDGVVSYSQSEVTAAALQGYRLFSNDEVLSGKAAASGTRTYPTRFLNPAQYSNIDRWFLDRPDGLYEFPIVKGRRIFQNGDNQGPDRVIFDSFTGTFVAVMSHRGNKPYYNALFPCNGHNEPTAGSGSGITGSIPVPMMGLDFWGSNGNLPAKLEVMQGIGTESLDNTATKTSSLGPMQSEFLYWDAIEAASCHLPDFCSDCNGTNSLYNDTFGICQLGNCTGYVCPNTPIPTEFATILPCNSTECYGMVENSTSTDGFCLFGNFTGFPCKPMCPSDEINCSDCTGTFDNTGTGVCGAPFYAGCPCKGDCPSNVTCNDDDCMGYNNLEVCNGGTLRGCPCASVCGPNFACNLNDCQGFNLNTTLGTCTNGDFTGCHCTPTCSKETLSCDDIANCVGITIEESALCTQGDYAGCTCLMSCPSHMPCSESDCGGVNDFCQEEKYFGCNCTSSTSTTTPRSSSTVFITTTSVPSPAPTATCVEWTDCPAGFCTDGASVECENGYCTCATE